ncbi:MULTISPECIES: hypothetical protein [unclassified Shewanella]|uniref:hypothetical protein n=1 Tax=unclassified Shewanella TaxID=196818 RepID=UPI00354B1F5F
MAKFSFHKEVWLVKDPQWLSDRALAWEPIEFLLLCDGVNKNRISAMKRYFIKGEWTEGSEYAPSLDTRMRWCPTISTSCFDEMVSEATTQYATQYLRETLVKSVMKVVPEEFMPFDDWHRRLTLFQWVTNDEVEYTDKLIEYNSFQVRAFPLETSKANGNYFSKHYLHWVSDWLYMIDSNQYQGFTILLPFWFTSLRHMDESIFEWDQNVKTINQLFLYIRHFIPEHACHAASQAKKEFVTEFLKCVEKYGFTLERMAELWKATAENKEDESVGREVRSLPLTSDNLETRLEDAFYNTYICDYKSKSDPVFIIHQAMKSSGLCEQKYNESDIKLVDISDVLTSEFKSELCRETVHAYHACFQLSPFYIGSDKLTVYQNVFLLLDNNNNQKVIMTESSALRNVVCNSRIFSGRRLLLMDTLREEHGLGFKRYLNYTHDDNDPNSMPPEPEEYLTYLKLLDIPFEDKDYSIFIYGAYGLQYGVDDQFKLVDGLSYSDFITE